MSQYNELGLGFLHNRDGIFKTKVTEKRDGRISIAISSLEDIFNQQRHYHRVRAAASHDRFLRKQQPLNFRQGKRTITVTSKKTVKQRKRAILQYCRDAGVRISEVNAWNRGKTKELSMDVAITCSILWYKGDDYEFHHKGVFDLDGGRIIVITFKKIEHESE